MPDVQTSTTRRRFLGRVAASLAAPALLRAKRDQPNVLWLMTDEQRRDSMGCYGSPWGETPRLDELASEGTIFEEAYTPSPVCVPARTSLLTGLHGSTTGVLHNRAPRLPDETRFLTWSFEEAGYRTASFGKKHYLANGRQAFQAEGGRAVGDAVSPVEYVTQCPSGDCDIVHYPGPTPWILAGRFPAPAEQTAEHRNVDLSMEWLSGVSAGEPFLLRLSLNAPHTPVVTPQEFVGATDANAIDLPFASDEQLSRAPPYERGALRDYQGSHRLGQSQIQRARAYYYDRVSFLDAEIGRLLDWMRKRNLLDNTIIVFVSDHGAHLGDHGLFQKQTFYEQVAAVPYFFWWPDGIQAEARIRTSVSTISLLPTLLECAGLEVPDAVETGGLQEVIEGGREPAPEPVFSEIKLGYRDYRDEDRLVMIRHGQYKLTLFLDHDDPERFRDQPEGSLYDLDADPRETRNLYGDKAHWKITEQLRKRIVEWDQQRISK